MMRPLTPDGGIHTTPIFSSRRTASSTSLTENDTAIKDGSSMDDLVCVAQCGVSVTSVEETNAMPTGVRGVGVVVRVRPMSTVEHADPSNSNCVQCLNDIIIVNRNSSATQREKALPARVIGDVHRPKQFPVDHVFHSHSTQIEVYEKACRPVVEGIFHGINGAILAYGSTGSGKTHTMFGSAMSAAGIVYQAIRDIFDEKVRLEEEEGKQVTVQCSFLEVYNEQVFDLLVPSHSKRAHTSQGSAPNPTTSDTCTQKRKTDVGKGGNGRRPLEVRDSTHTGTRHRSGKHADDAAECLNICGLTYLYPESPDDFARGIEQGHAHRFVASTGVNAHSSRSHAIITVEVRVRHAANINRETVARIRFCDLAGSERAASTSNTGIRLREGGNINCSLLALGAVVQSLAQRSKYPNRNIFVPYRGSKLTRLLRECIGGNSRTQMLFCVSPTTKQYEETLNTMLFAMQAKKIQALVRRNEYNVNSVQVAKSQEAIIAELRQELAVARGELARMSPGSVKARSVTGTLGVPMDSLSQYSSQTAFGTVTSVTSASVARSELQSPNPQQAFSHPTSPALGVTGLGSAEPGTTPIPGTFQLYAIGSSLPVLDLSLYQRSAPRFSETSPVAVDLPEVPADSFTDRVRSLAPALTGRASARPSVFTEGSPMFTELETRLKTFTAEKDALYHKMRDAEEKQSEMDIQLREQKWRLATFLASQRANSKPDGDEGDDEYPSTSTPVGVAGLRNVIARMTAERKAQGTEMTELLDKLDHFDRQIAATRQELLHEKQHHSLELLLDHARLRQSCTEAECLAAHYHQECRVMENRNKEFAHALSTCVSALRAAIPALPPSTLRSAAHLALLYAYLPTTSTDEMITVFEDLIHTGTEFPMPCTVQRQSSPHAQPTTCRTLEDHYQELVNAANRFKLSEGGRGRRNSHPPRTNTSQAPSLNPVPAHLAHQRLVVRCPPPAPMTVAEISSPSPSGTTLDLVLSPLSLINSQSSTTFRPTASLHKGRADALGKRPAAFARSYTTTSLTQSRRAPLSYVDERSKRGAGMGDCRAAAKGDAKRKTTAWSAKPLAGVTGVSGLRGSSNANQQSRAFRRIRTDTSVLGQLKAERRERAACAVQNVGTSSSHVGARETRRSAVTNVSAHGKADPMGNGGALFSRKVSHRTDTASAASRPKTTRSERRHPTTANGRGSSSPPRETMSAAATHKTRTFGERRSDGVDGGRPFQRTTKMFTGTAFTAASAMGHMPRRTNGGAVPKSDHYLMKKGEPRRQRTQPAVTAHSKVERREAAVPSTHAAESDLLVSPSTDSGGST